MLPTLTATVLLAVPVGQWTVNTQAPQPDTDVTLLGEPVDVDLTERRIQANAHYAAGISRHAKGEIEASAQELIQAIQTDPGNVALVLRVSEKLLEWNLAALSLQALKTAIQQENPPVELLVRKGEALRALGQEPEALAAFTEAIKISPGNTQARREIVTARLKAKEVETALSLVRDGVALPSLNGKQLVGLVGLYLQCLATSPDLLATVSPELEKLLERTQNFELDAPEDKILLADGFTFAGELGIAQQLLRDVLNMAPETTMAREKLVGLYLRDGKTELAVEQLETLLSINPRNASTHYLLGSIATENQAYEEAISHYGKVIEIQPEFEPLYYEISGLHLNNRQPRQALEILTRARIRFPKRFQGEFYTGIALASLSRTKEALNHLIEAEKIATKQAPQRLTPFFYFQLGSMHERNGNYTTAEQKFLKSLETNPDNPVTLNYLGYMWAEQGKKLRQASEWIQRALELAPENPAIQDSMGWVLYQQGNHKQALFHLLNAEAGLEQADPVILDHLGDTYNALGDNDKAIEAWKRSLELEFNDKIFRKLKELEQDSSASS